MHRCLKIAEIQELICEEIDVSTHYRERSLVSLALSCKAFLTPAMASLWRIQTSLIPLLCTMPEDLLNKKGTPGNKWLRIKRSIRKEDWERPFFYSRYIKELVVDRYHGLWTSNTFVGPREFSSTVLSSLARLQSLPGLLHHVRVLKWTYIESEIDVAVLAMSVGPHLSSLTINCYRAPQLQIFNSEPLSTILAKSPGIQGLYIIESEVSVQFARTTFTAAIHSCKFLQYLTIHALTIQGAIVLSQLPQLQSLEISRWTLSPAQDDAHELPDSGFLALHSLHVHNHDSIQDPSSPTLFAMMKQSPLSFINITLADEDLDHLPTINHLFSALRPSDFSKSLKRFVLIAPQANVDIQHNPVEYEFGYMAGAFEQLLAFKNLECVMLAIPFPLERGRGQFARLAHKWPNLTDLDFINLSGRMPPTFTIQDLVFLAACPNLYSVSLCLDATNVSPMQMAEAMNMPRSESKHTIGFYLRLYSSPLEDPPSVAAFLASVFWFVYLYPPLGGGRENPWQMDHWPEEDKDGIKVGGWNTVKGLLDEVFEQRLTITRVEDSPRTPPNILT